MRRFILVLLSLFLLAGFVDYLINGDRISANVSPEKVLSTSGPAVQMPTGITTPSVPTSTPTTPSEPIQSEPYLVYSPYIVTFSAREYLGEDYDLYCAMIDSVLNYDGRVSGFESEEHFRKIWRIMLSEFHPAQKVCAHYGNSEKPFTYEDGVVQLGMPLEREEHNRIIRAFAERITKDLACVNKGDTEVQIVAKLYKYVSGQLKYEMKYDNLYDVIMYNKGVCGSYSNYLILLLNHAGIECHNISGGGHAWVIAKMDGQYYHFDPTNERGSSDWFWFARSDEKQITAIDNTTSDPMILRGDWDYETGTWREPYVCPTTYCEETRTSSRAPWLW